MNGYAKFYIMLSTLIILFNATLGTIEEKTIDMYPMTAIVTEISEKEDTVTIQNFNKQTYIFKGVEDYDVGDMVACIMSDNRTKNVLDDEIVTVRYTGYLEGWDE